MGNLARQNRKQTPQGFGVEKLHASGTEPAFFDRTQGARCRFAERPICFCRSAVDSQDNLLRHATHG